MAKEKPAKPKAGGKKSQATRRVALLALAMLIFAVMLPVRVTYLLWALGTRALLVIATLILCVYFIATTVVTGPMLFSLANDNLMGTYGAEHVDINLPKMKVTVFGVYIRHHSGQNLITVDRLETRIDLLALAAWGFKQALGVSAPPEISLRDIRVEGYRVVIPFTEDGIIFHEMFLPSLITPDDGEPSGPPPVITLSHIWLGKGEVALTWPDWRIDVDVDNIAADMRIDAGEDILLTVRTVEGPAFTLTELLPEPVKFASEMASAFKILNVKLTLAGLTVRDGHFVHPDMDVYVDEWSFNWDEDNMPCNGSGRLELHSPDKLEHLTFGSVFGQAAVAFKMFGRIELPGFEFDLKSSRLDVLGMELENVHALATLDLTPLDKDEGVSIAVPVATAEYAGGEVVVSNNSIAITGEGVPDVGFDVCFADLLPGLALYDLGIEAALDYVDVLATGCCQSCRVAEGDDGIRADGTVSMVADVGALRNLTGIAGGELEGYVSWNSGTAAWKGLSLITDIASLSSVGFLNTTEDLAGRVDASLQVHDLGHIPLLGLAGISGRAVADDMSFSGTLSDPFARLALHLHDFNVAGEHFKEVELSAVLDEWTVNVPSFCFSHKDNQGCLAGQVALRDQVLPGGTVTPGFPVQLRIADPLTVDLNQLPFLPLPLVGRLTLGPANLTATVENDILASLGSLQGDLSCKVDKFRFGDVSADSIYLTGQKEPLLDDRYLLGPIELSTQIEGLSVDELNIDRAEAQLALTRIPSRTLDLSFIPFAVAKGAVTLDGIAYRDSRLARLTLDLSGLQQEGRRDRIALMGRVKPSVGPSLRYSGEILPESRTGALKVTMNGVKLAALPPDFVPGDIRDLLAETLLSGVVNLRDIDLSALVAGNIERVFRRITADGRLHVDNLESLPEPVGRAYGRFRVAGGKISIKPLTLRLRNGSRLRVDGSYWPLKERVAADLTLSPTALMSLRTFKETGVPLEGDVSGTISVDGPISSARLRAGLSVADFTAAGIQLGDASVTVKGEIGRRLEIESPGFFPGLTLNNGAMTFDGLWPDKLFMDFDFTKLDLNRIIGVVPDYLVVKADGHISMGVRFSADGEPLNLNVDIPVEKLSACVTDPDLELCLANSSPARISVSSQGATLHDISLVGDGHSLSGDGEIHFVRGWDMDVRLGVDLSALKLLGEYFASYAGRVGSMKVPLHLSGPMETPRVTGPLRVSGLELLPRGMGSEITVPNATVQLSGEALNGNILALMEEDSPVQGTFDEGEFATYGWLKLAEWLPDSGLVYFTGKELFYQEPGSFRLVLSPRVEMVFKDLTDEKKASGSISGDVFVSEGEFTENFDLLLGSFATAFSRSQERYSKPLTESFPFLKGIGLDLRVQGGNFAISSRFPFGETELAVNLDLKVGGTVHEPKVWDWMFVVPGGTITYKLVKRVFTVTQGSVEFSGDYTEPYLDIEAQTEVPYSGSNLDFGSSSLENDMWGTTVDITIRLRGVYPNLEPEYFSNRPGFDDADLQSLLLLGMTRKDLEGRSDGGEADISINLLTEDIAGMVSKLLLAPFVDSVSLGFTQEGGILAEAATKIGRAINLSARVRQDSGGSEYSARIQFKITDRLSLEGRMKTIEDEQETLRRYEGKFRYIIPLD